MFVTADKTKNNDATLLKEIVTNSIKLLVIFSISLISTLVLAENQTNSTTPLQHPDLNFTQEERNWLMQHPVIRIGTSTSFPPHLMRTHDGTLIGMIPDLYQLLEERLGIQFEMHEFGWPGGIQDLKNNKVDVISLMNRDVATSHGLLTTEALLTPQVTVFARKDSQIKLSRDNDISDYRVAYFKNILFIKKHIEEENIKGIPANSIMDTFSLLLQKKADVMLGNYHDSYFLSKNLITEIEPVYLFKNLKSNPVQATRTDMPLLLGIIQKGFSTVSFEEKNKIASKWNWTPKPLEIKKKTKFTLKELEWLAKKYTVRVRISDYPPFEFINQKQQGISVDYLKLIAERSGINFSFIPENNPFTNTLEDMTNVNGPDLIASETPSYKRETPSFVSKSYFTSPRVIYVLNSNKHIHGIEDLKGQTLAVSQKNYIHKQLENQYPFINLQHYDSEKHAMEAVAFGNADAYIGNLTQGSFLIASQRLSNLKVAAPTPLKEHLFSYVSRKDWPELGSIINKGIDSITPAERTNIRKKYIFISYEHAENAAILKWLMIVTIVATGLIFLFLIWNRQLSQEVSKRKKAEDDLQNTNQRLALAIEVASVGIWDWDIAKEVGTWNDKMFEIYQIPPPNPVPFGAWAQVVHPDDIKRTVEFFELTIKTGLTDFIEYRIIMPDHSIQHIHAATMPIKDENNHIISMFGVNIDISEQKLIEEKLEQRVLKRTAELRLEVLEREKATDALAISEEKYRTLVETSLAGVFYTNLKGDLLYVNDAIAKMYEFENPEQMYAEGILPRWGDLKHRDEFLAELRATGIANNFESEMVTCSGNHIHVMISSKLQGDVISGMVMDITDRKKTEIALSTSEKKFRTIFDQTATGFVEGNLQGQFTHANQKVCEITGYSEDELKKLTNKDISVPKEFSVEEKLFKQMLEGRRKSVNLEKRIIRKDGKKTWIKMSSTVLRNELSQPLSQICAVEDINTRKQAEKALLASEQNFRATFEQGALGFAHVSPEGYFQRINQKFCDITGYSREEMLKLAIKDITHPQDFKIDLGFFQQLLKGEKNNFSRETRLIRKKGDDIWVNLTATLVRDDLDQPLFVVSTIEDITSRKQTETLLIESEARFRTLFENAPVMIDSFDESGRCVMWNKECESVYGWSTEEIFSHKKPLELFYPDPAVRQQVVETIIVTPVNLFKERHPTTKDGSEVTCLWASFKLPDGKTINIGYDITERKLDEKRILEYQQRLKSLAAQLTLAEERERRRIAADLHDNVGQSLALTRLQLAAARKGLPKDKKQDALFDDMSQTLLGAIQDTRHLIFELSSPFLNELGLKSALNEWMEEQITNQHQIKFKLTDKSKNQTLDKDLQAILFRNVRELLINVIKYAKATFISVKLEHSTNIYSITVEDDGVGFDPEIAMLNDGSNKSFGLFSVQERMADLGGWLKIQSKPGSGSRFVLYLPTELNKKDSHHE